MTLPYAVPATGYRDFPVQHFTDTASVNLFVRSMCYLFVMSIPFEMPNRTIPIEIPTLAGFLFLGSTLFAVRASYKRITPAMIWFAIYMWLLALLTVLTARHGDIAARHIFSLTQIMFVAWALSNLIADPRVIRGVLLAIVVSIAARAAIQLLGIGTTSYTLWGGGERYTVLGQNANLSAIIMSGGLAVMVGLFITRDPRLPKLGWIAIPLALITGAAIIQTGSRGGVICVLAGLLALATAGKTARTRVRNGIAAIVAVGVLTWGTMQSEVMRHRIEQAAVEGHLAGRERIYPAAWQMLLEKPLLGWGPIENQYEIGRRIQETERASRDAHNLVLELMTSTGLLGTVPFLMGLLLTVRGAWRARRGPLGAIPLAFLMAVLAGTITGTWIAAKMLWLAFAIAVGAYEYWTPRPAKRMVV